MESDPRRYERYNIDEENETDGDDVARDRECRKLLLSKVDTHGHECDQLVDAQQDTVRAMGVELTAYSMKEGRKSRYAKQRASKLKSIFLSQIAIKREGKNPNIKICTIAECTPNMVRGRGALTKLVRMLFLENLEASISVTQRPKIALALSPKAAYTRFRDAINRLSTREMLQR